MKREEAISNVRSFIGQLTDECQESIRALVPELCESEDERIRKEIINYLDFAESHNLLRAADYEKKKRWADWLEKQKEQKFKNPSVIRYDRLGLTHGEYLLYNLIYTFCAGEGVHMDNTRGDLKNYVKRYYTELKESCIKELKPAEWSEKHIADAFEKVGLAKIVREQSNDELTNAVQSAMIELSKTESMEWSEEDKETIEKLHRLLIICRGEKKFIPEADYDKMDSLLKSLCPSWKSSEDLEEEIERIAKCEKEFMNFQFKSQLIGYVARHFAQWQKDQMLKDAVEGEVVSTSDNGWECIRIYKKLYKCGDKVRIIIIKGDEK